jgi:hypothetical protein
MVADEVIKQATDMLAPLAKDRLNHKTNKPKRSFFSKKKEAPARRAHANWRAFVEPGVTGPLFEVNGYRVFVAEKHVSEKDDKVVITFANRSYVWLGEAWHRSETKTPKGKGSSKNSRGPSSISKEELAKRKAEAGGGNDFWMIWPHLPRDEHGNVIPLKDVEGSKGAVLRAKALKLQYPDKDSKLSITVEGIKTTWEANAQFSEIAETWCDYQTKVYLFNEAVWEHVQLLEARSKMNAVVSEMEQVMRAQSLDEQRSVAYNLSGPTLITTRS